MFHTVVRDIIPNSESVAKRSAVDRPDQHKNSCLFLCGSSSRPPNATGAAPPPKKKDTQVNTDYLWNLEIGEGDGPGLEASRPLVWSWAPAAHLFIAFFCPSTIIQQMFAQCLLCARCRSSLVKQPQCLPALMGLLSFGNGIHAPVPHPLLR